MLAQTVTNNHQAGKAEGASRRQVNALERFAQRLLQLAHPVRQAEDFFGSDSACEAENCRGAAKDDLTIGAPSISPPVLLQLACAANPLDFWPLIERGFAEWSRTSDAMIDGAPFEGALDLFRHGLGSGALDLFLGVLDGAPEKPREVLERFVFPALPVESASQAPEVEGCGVVQDAKQLIGEPGCRFVPCLFDVVSVFHGHLQGHLLWVAPEYRGRGLVGQYFDAALAVARRHGLNGFMFLSTLPFWERRAPRYGFEARGCIRQPNGSDVIGWFREVC
jgi:ribosomal protein S18 acetylase RimI-like enzyme